MKPHIMEENKETSNKRPKEDFLLLKNKRVKSDDTRSSKIRREGIVSGAQQLATVEQTKQNYEGSEYYMISKDWYLSWERYCLGLSRAAPGAIDNSRLLLENKEIKPDLLQEEYFIMPASAIQSLRIWYGFKEPSHKILLESKPTAASSGTRLKRKYVEAKSMTLTNQTTASANSNERTIPKEGLIWFTVYTVGQDVRKNEKLVMSPESTISEFQTSLLNALSPPLGYDMDLWLLNNQNNFLLQRIRGSSLSKFVITTVLLSNSDRYAKKVDVRTISLDSTINSCLSTMSTTTSSKDHYHLAVDFFKKKSLATSSTPNTIPKTPTKRPFGLCGLQNLGNTCYMNSALQCLSNTPQLTRWFLKGEYLNDINRLNPLGLNGELAESYALLLRNIWKSNHTTVGRTCISPKGFKSTFERFNAHFVGYLQQDSQELLSFLLDGLHEDLNRILNKPYMEIPDFDDHLSDLEISNSFWKYHKARNDSIIVDLFQGQYKSRLICEACKKVKFLYSGRVL